MTSRAAVVDVRSLHVRFGEVEAVAGVDLTAYAGHATALLGRNGAGKSTTMRVLAGVVPPTAGTRWSWPATTSAPSRSRSSAPSATAPTSAAWCRGRRRGSTSSCPRGCAGSSNWEDRARDLLERFELGDVAHRVTTGFSHGMGRRLSVCLAALHEPEVLLLDEPFDGVDPIGVEATFDVINDARSRGACVLVSTHLRELAVEACSSVLVLRGGAQVATATAGEMAGEEGARAYRSLLD